MGRKKLFRYDTKENDLVDDVEGFHTRMYGGVVLSKKRHDVLFKKEYLSYR